MIGGEGALVLGGLAAAVAGTLLGGAAPLAVQLAMAVAGMLAGAAWICLAGAMADRTPEILAWTEAYIGAGHCVALFPPRPAAVSAAR